MYDFEGLHKTYKEEVELLARLMLKGDHISVLTQFQRVDGLRRDALISPFALDHDLEEAVEKIQEKNQLSNNSNSR